MKYLRFLKLRSSLLLYIATFVLTSTVGVYTASAANTVFCGVSIGSTIACQNLMTINDQLAYSTAKLFDQITGTDAYHIKHNKATAIGNVDRGNPFWQNYVVYDNFNSTYYTYDDWYGYYLSDPQPPSITTGKSLGYYPQQYGSPSTTLDVHNADAFSCASPQGIYCKTYTQASQFNIN